VQKSLVFPAQKMYNIPNMGSAMKSKKQTYFDLIESLINSPRDEQIAILQNNLELIDDNFTSVLPEWANQTLAGMESEEATNITFNILKFSNLIQEFQQGSKSSNMEIAIAGYEVGREIFKRYDDREKLAATQNNLGEAYRNRIKGEQGENIEQAIAFYEAALEVYSRAAFPEQWAGTQNNLANAYFYRIKGERGENIEQAIKFYEEALQVRTRDAFRQQWAQTQNNLANAYLYRIKGERGENIERAIAFYEEALQVRTRDAFPQDWAQTQNNLAIAYLYRIQGERGENIERASALFKAALEVRIPTALPIDCLQTGQNLGTLGFAESLWETAIFGYEKAIEAVEQTREWVTSQSRKRQIIEQNLDVYEKMMQSCINHQQYDKALQTIERSKSRYLVELFTNSEIYPKTATDTEKQQLQNLRSQIAASQQLLDTETPSPPPLSPPLTKGGPGGVPEDSPSQPTTQTRSLSPEYFQQQKAKLETTSQQLTQLLEQIKQREPEFTLTQKVEPIDITKFQQTLDTKTVIVEWYIGNNSNSDDSWGGSAFIITRDSIQPVTYTTTKQPTKPGKTPYPKNSKNSQKSCG
jgi:tetratricopeptide (TPR) repeat protein